MSAEHRSMPGGRIDSDLFSNPDRFADLDGWRAEDVELHASGRVHRTETDGFDPFWAVMGHDEVMSVQRRHAEFTKAPQPVLGSRVDLDARAASGIQLRRLINKDAPDHPKYRKLTADWFKPASGKRMSERLDALSVQAVAKLAELGGRADFIATANLDPRVFEDPLRFDVTRKNANEHVAFGYGVHFCLGAQLARMELLSPVARLVPRRDSLELTGEAPTYRTTFVGGQKAVPVAYTLRAAS